MAVFDLRGAAGRLCWSYHVAAEIGKFTIVGLRKSSKSELRAKVLSADPFKVQQSPLVFEVPIASPDGTKKGLLRWTLSNVVIKDGVLTATIGE